MNLSNEDFTLSYSPISDIGAGIVFGLGYYLISHLYGDNFEWDFSKKESIVTLSNNFESVKTIDEVNNIIKTQKRDDNLNPFEILSKIHKQNLNPDISTYNYLLNYCYENGKYNYADKLEEEIFDFASPVHCNIMTYNILLKGLGHMFQAEVSSFQKERILEKMNRILSILQKENSSIKLNEITINSCLYILIKAGEIEKAWELFDTMNSKYDISPDKYSYSIMMKALRIKPNLNRLSKILKVIEIINNTKKEKQALPEYDEIILNSLIETCFKLGNVSKAEELFNLMKEMKILRTKVTYSVMIKGYGQIYEKEKALELFNKMKQEGVFPNEVVYGCILNTCVRCFDINNAKVIFKEMKSHNYEINNHICSTMIKAFTRSSDYNSALEIFNHLISCKKQTPNIIVYNSILDASVQLGEYNKMNEIYENLLKKLELEPESTPQPDLITLSTLIKGHSKNKDFEKVMEIYDYLKSKQTRDEIKLDEVFYNSLLDACVMNSKFKTGKEVINEMKSKKINFSNVTYSIMIKLYSKEGMSSKKILEILDEMKLNNIKPGLVVYTCLIQSCIKEKNLKKSFILFEELKNNKISPDHVVYSSLINGCLINREIEASYTFILDSFANNVRMSDKIYNKFFNIILSKKTLLKDNLKKEYSLKIYSMLKARKFLLDKEIIKKITDIICKSNRNLLNYI